MFHLNMQNPSANVKSVAIGSFTLEGMERVSNQIGEHFVSAIRRLILKNVFKVSVIV